MKRPFCIVKQEACLKSTSLLLETNYNSRTVKRNRDGGNRIWESVNLNATPPN